jgi:hypothetical protein
MNGIAVYRSASACELAFPGDAARTLASPTERAAAALGRKVYPQLTALERAAKSLATPVRHGFLLKPDVVDALYLEAEAVGLIDNVGCDVVEETIGRGLENFEPEPEAKSNGKAGSHGGPFNWRDHVYTAAELQRRTFPAVSCCVPELIPEGLTIIAGKPKIGKSWMALDVCIAIAAGRFCLGERKPEQGDVLYAAMEDNPCRLQRRIDRLLSPFSTEWPERLTLANAWRRLDKGGVDDVQQWIEHAEHPRLAILDTLAGVKPIRTREGYSEDYESLAALHRLASTKAVSIIVLHHTRKMEAEDPVDTVSGTLVLAGCADSVLVLARSGQGTTLYVRGRDIEEAEHAVSFDKIGCRWTILGNASDVHRSNERGKILAALAEAKEALTPKEIVAATEMPPNNVWQLLFKMAKDGEVVKVGHGKYRHPDHPETVTPDKDAKEVRMGEI